MAVNIHSILKTFLNNSMTIFHVVKELRIKITIRIPDTICKKPFNFISIENIFLRAVIQLRHQNISFSPFKS